MVEKISGHRMSLTVQEVSQRKIKEWVSGTGNDAVFRDKTIGWYVSFNEAPFSIYVGMAEPEYTKGDKVWLTITKQS